ncbi:MAG: hypothetical protein Aurels2KO_32860 [Aureliella sp.]
MSADRTNGELGGWTLVVAVANNGVIGAGDQLPWRISSDLKRFKKMTMGNCLLMGRTTFESIGKALPGRQTIVLSRRGFDSPDGVAIASGLEQVDSLVDAGRKVMVVGGAQVYQSALSWCSTAWITRVLADVDGDTHFSRLPASEWSLESTESFDAGPKDDYPTELQIWQRVSNDRLQS